MRLAISGTANIGKSTVIQDFLKEWPGYSTDTKTYRDILKEKNLPHSQSTNKETQWAILNHMVDSLQTRTKRDKVIFDRCPLDNIVYSIWAMGKGGSDIDKEFIDKCIPLVRESIKFLDIIFFIPITKVAPVAIVEDGIRDTDQEFIQEIDNIMKTIVHTHRIKVGSTPFLAAYDCPPIIELFGAPQERIQMIRNYIDADGDLIGDNTSMSTAGTHDMQALVEQMGVQLEKEKNQARLLKKFSIKR